MKLRRTVALPDFFEDQEVRARMRVNSVFQEQQKIGLLIYLDGKGLEFRINNNSYHPQRGIGLTRNVIKTYSN